MDQPFRYTRERSYFEYIVLPVRTGCLILLYFGMLACTIERVPATAPNEQPATLLENSPSVKGQINPPLSIRSIQVYRKEDKGSLPAIRLGSDEFITLRFDELGKSVRMFRVRIRHRNADWTPSVLMKQFYLGGYREDLISGGRPSGVQNPSYTHYHYRFPNENMRIEMSGNYLMEILEYETSRLLFSIPFFVYENQGQLQFRYEELFGLDERYPVHHQPFLYYRYPSFVVTPDIDLRLFVVQNRFWGRAREADQEDISGAGTYRAYLSRDRSFIGVYEFRPLDLSRYDEPGPDILDIRPETVPPRVYLFRDVVNLDRNPPRSTPSVHGLPRDDYRARYVDVRFELEIPEREDSGLPVYVYGPFNNWSLSEDNRLEFRASTGTYVGRSIIKEGLYDYTYAIREQKRVDDLRLDASFASTRQEYTSLVYFRDPRWQIYRLLQLHTEHTRH